MPPRHEYKREPAPVACKCGCGKLFERFIGGRRREYAEDCPNKLQRNREAQRAWMQMVRKRAGPKLCSCGCGKPVVKSYTRTRPECSKRIRAERVAAQRSVANDVKPRHPAFQPVELPDEDGTPEHFEDAGSIGKECRMCAGLSWRRPEGHPCKCGESYVPERKRDIMEFGGLHSSAGMATGSAFMSGGHGKNLSK